MTLVSADVLTICDTTLRDGNHAVAHQLSRSNIRNYARAAELAGVDVVEVGHGNGLGASSLQVGRAALSDREMLLTAKAELSQAKLGVLSIPGFANIERDLKPALDCGVDEVRVGAHCTEADVTRQQISMLSTLGVAVKGLLLMTHMVSPEELLEQARRMQDYGAGALVLMDSAGAYRPVEVSRKVGLLSAELAIPVGFHAHDNLGLAVANTLTAVDAGASIVDVTARGFGAGAGNAPLELVAANLYQDGVESRLHLYAALDAAELAQEHFVKHIPSKDSVTITSGIAGVFSGFAAPVCRAARQFGVDARDILLALGDRRVVAGQEDTIIEAAMALASVGVESRQSGTVL
jgi:4-hydroxy 2-oxovalerate aldolase